MNIPKQIYAGTTVKWRDDGATGPLDESITSADWTLTYYLRFNHTHEGHTVVGTSYGTGWEFSISATDSAAFNSGDWYFYAEASKGAEKFTLGSGRLEVFSSLAYTGQPDAFDGRTQAEQDLDAVTTAIRQIVSDKVKSYTIAGRSFTKIDMPDLVLRESQLKAIVARERKAAMIANGLGDPHSLYVRF